MLKKLKNIFIVEDENQADTPPASSESDKQPAPKSAGPSFKVDKNMKNSPPKPGKSKPDEKFTNLLLKAIEDNNIEGFDYIEFKQSVQSLSKVEPDEGKRYKNAFAMAGAMGLTKSKLFSSAKHYVNILDSEEKKFSEAFNAQKQKQVNQKESKSTELQQSINTKEDQIKKLQASIEKEKKQLGSIESDISKALAKVEATKEGFYGAYHMVLQQIKDDLDKISTHL